MDLPPSQRQSSVELYWLPLGAGDTSGCVRWNGRMFEATMAWRQHRHVRDLYHSALIVRLSEDHFVLEMAPVWGNEIPDRGVVTEGAVGMQWLACSRLFRYEIRCWRDGIIPDIAEAVASAQNVGTDGWRARRLLDLAPAFPAATWGRDELHAGEMWNSNSLTAWLLARSGHDIDAIVPPINGRAPGWSAGLAGAARQGAILTRTKARADRPLVLGLAPPQEDLR